MSECIVLIGFKSSGKTTYGRLLAEASRRRFVDLDVLLEALHHAQHGTRRLAHEVYHDLGAEGFRRLEREAIEGLGDTRGAVIATTGATVLDPPNVPALRRLGPLVLIDTPKAVIRERWLAGRLPRFLDARDPHGSFERLYAIRREVYLGAADGSVPTAGRRDEEVVADLLAFGGRATPPRHP